VYNLLKISQFTFIHIFSLVSIMYKTVRLERNGFNTQVRILFSSNEQGFDSNII